MSALLQFQDASNVPNNSGNVYGYTIINKNFVVDKRDHF